MVRAPCCSKMGLNRGPWIPEEDELLAKYIEAHGEGCWRGLPKAAGLLRCGKSCRLRWVNYLRPTVKRGNISEDEEDLIIKLHSLLGNRWSLIAARMPGRTDNEIKNYWNTHLSKKLARKGINPKTHKRLDNSDSKHSKAGHCICQPFNILDPMHTINANNTENLNESKQSALAFLGTDCDYQIETARPSCFIANIRTPIVSDNIGDVAKEVSSTRSDEDHSKNNKEASSSSSESPKRSRYSQEVISLNSMINYHTISSVNSGRSFHHLQWLQPDRANSRDYIRSDTTASVSMYNCANRFKYGTPPSSIFCDFSETSSKCNSLSDFTKTSPVMAVSSLDCMVPNEEINDTYLFEDSGVSPVREFSPLPGRKASTITMPASEADEVLNNTAAFHDSTKFFVSPKNSLSGNKLQSIQPLSPNDPVVEEEIWNCVDNSAIAECLGTVSPLEKPLNVWNVPECNIITGFYDFQEDLASFEWWLFNFFGDGDKGSCGLNHVEYLPEEFDDFQNLIQDSPL